jgi:hypothetical protein
MTLAATSKFTAGRLQSAAGHHKISLLDLLLQIYPSILGHHKEARSPS